jgi:hypothetical protein
MRFGIPLHLALMDLHAGARPLASALLVIGGRTAGLPAQDTYPRTTLMYTRAASVRLASTSQETMVRVFLLTRLLAHGFMGDGRAASCGYEER